MPSTMSAWRAVLGDEVRGFDILGLSCGDGDQGEGQNVTQIEQIIIPRGLQQDSDEQVEDGLHGLVEG